MKKLLPNILLTVTLVFAAFTCGFLLGRNYNHGQVQLTYLSAAGTARTAQTAPSVSFGTVPTTEAWESETTIPETTALSGEYNTDGKININTASVATLMLLPGIGGVLAQRIVDYRDSHGEFKTVAELTNVSGIGEKKLENIIDLVTTGG